jgi:hypothetical protein
MSFMRKFFYVFFLIIFSSLCHAQNFKSTSVQSAKKNESIPVTLYRDRVESGNSMTSFVNSNDPDGKIAMAFCDEFRKLYEVHTRAKYVCAPISYKEYTPNVKWNISN